MKVYHWPHRQPIADLIFSFAKWNSNNNNEFDRFPYCKQRNREIVGSDSFASNVKQMVWIFFWTASLHSAMGAQHARYALVFSGNSISCGSLAYDFFLVSIDILSTSLGAKGNIQVFTPTEIHIVSVCVFVSEWSMWVYGQMQSLQPAMRSRCKMWWLLQEARVRFTNISH